MPARKRAKAPDMFAQAAASRAAGQAPLAARMRPQTLDEFVGQEHLVGEGHLLRKAIEADEVPSMVLWGPPGSGKTTLARIIAGLTKSHFAPVSAVAAGVADLRRIVAEATDRLGMHSGRTILFIDEIHRFNKAQQDAVLPYVEDGTVTLIGATTENPSFEVISPLLSRSRVYALEPLTAEQFCAMALALGERYAQAIAAALRPRDAPDLIAVHGKTIVHRPPVSWQLINPAPIAARFGCPVVYNLRQADIAAGGQGAPITPIADWILFRDRLHRRAIVNLGGFCNATILPAARSGKPLEQVRGFDICACNLVLDAVARQTLGTPYDQGGGAAQCGAPHAKAVQDLCATFRRQRSEHRSLGTADEASDWVAQHKIRIPPNDLAATAVEAVAECIGAALAEHDVDQIIIAGGGAHNRALVEAIDLQCHTPARLIDALGVPIQAREALAMAVLGALCADGIPITLPQVTGCTDPAPVAGMWCLPMGPAWASR